jgi:hypothetical protein
MSATALLMACCCTAWPPSDPCETETPPCASDVNACGTCPTHKTPASYTFTISGVRFDCLPSNHDMACGCALSACGGFGGEAFTITDAEFAGSFQLDAVSACEYEYRENGQSTVTIMHRDCATGLLDTDVSGDFDLVIHWHLSTGTGGGTMTVTLFPNGGGDCACRAGTGWSIHIASFTIPVGVCAATSVANCGYVDNVRAGGNQTTTCFSIAGTGGYNHGKGGTVTGEACT